MVMFQSKLRAASGSPARSFDGDRQGAFVLSEQTDSRKTVGAAEAGAEPWDDAEQAARGESENTFLYLRALITPRPLSGRIVCYRTPPEIIDGIGKWADTVARDALLVDNCAESGDLLTHALPASLSLLYLHEIPEGLTDAGWQVLAAAPEINGGFVLRTSTLELPLLPPWLLAGSALVHCRSDDEANLDFWLFRLHEEAR